MPLWWENEKELKERLEKERREKAREAERNVGINVENHQNSGAAQIHQEKIHMDAQKQAEIDKIKNVTQKTLDDLNETNYQKKKEIAETSSKQKAQTIKEHEAKLKQRELEREEAARKQGQRTDGLRKDQDEAINKTEQLKQENLREQIKETKKTSELQNEINDEQMKLNKKQNKELHETEKRALEDILQVEMKHSEMVESDYQETHAATQKLQQNAIEIQFNSLALRITLANEGDVRAVNDEINKAKNLVVKLSEMLEKSSELLVAKMDKNEKKTASAKLELLKVELTQLTNDLTVMEKRAMKIPEEDVRKPLQDTITQLRKDITTATQSITDVKRDLRSTEDFAVKKRKKMEKKVQVVIDMVANIPQLVNNDKEIRQSIMAKSEALDNQRKAIENSSQGN